MGRLVRERWELKVRSGFWILNWIWLNAGCEVASPASSQRVFS